MQHTGVSCEVQLISCNLKRSMPRLSCFLKRTPTEGPTGKGGTPMSSISMEWLGGPIVLKLTQDEIMQDLDGDWAVDVPSSVDAAGDDV